MSRRSDDLTTAKFLRGLTLGAILGAIIAGSSIWSRRFRRNVDGGRARRSVAGAELAAGADLDPSALVGGRMLDEGDQPGRHEPAVRTGFPERVDLADLDDTARRDDLDPAAGLGRDDVERLDALARIDHGLDSVAFDRRMLRRAPAQVRRNAALRSSGPRSRTSPCSRRRP